MKTQEEIKTSFRLSKELEYKTGEVVAKDVFTNANGGVRLLAFDKGAMLARHFAPGDVLVYVIEGSIEFEIDDTRQELKTGDSILLPSGTSHTVLALDRSRVLLTRINA